MKKEDFSGLIVYLLILAIAIIFGLNVLKVHAANSGMDTFVYMAFILGAILTGVLLNSILFEIAHIAGAKAGGYQILSVCILGLLFIKEGKKTNIKLSPFDGLTGETKILPRAKGEKESNPTPYLWFGTLFYLVELIATIVSFVLLSESTLESKVPGNVAHFILVVGVIGGMILLYNILPLKLDSTTDGYRMTMVTNTANKKAFNELLRVEYAVSQGQEVEVETFTDITNFTAELNLNKVYMLLDKREYNEAEKLLDITINSKDTISEKVYVRARAQKIYINIFTKPLDEAKKFYDEEVSMQERRAISNDLSMVSVRTYLLMSGLLDKSRSECLIAIKNVTKCFSRTPKQRQNTEIILFNEALEKVNQLHPDWELLEYKLEKVEEKKDKKKK